MIEIKFNEYLFNFQPEKRVFFCSVFANCPGPLFPIRVQDADRAKCCFSCVGEHNPQRAENFDCLCNCPACRPLKG